MGNAYYLARRFLSQETRNRLKQKILFYRNSLGPFYKLKYGTFDATDFKSAITGAIGDDFDILMVHSSFDALLPMYQGDIIALLKALLSICENKTLVMPSFVFEGFRKVEYNGSLRPLFDVKKTPSQMGLFTELFRKYKGTKRSMHPTHSVCAYGPLADELTQLHHQCPTGCGLGTPFDIMTKYRTVILGVGVYFYRCLTQVHHVEDVLGHDFPFAFEYGTVDVLVKSPSDTFVYTNEFKKNAGVHRHEELLRDMMSKDDLVEWKFHGVPMFYTYADKVSQALFAAAKEGKTVYI